MSTDIVFGLKLKEFRIGRGLKQDVLAFRANLSQPEISKIEKGNVKHLKRETIEKLAEALELPPTILVQGTSFAPIFGESPIFADGVTEETPPIIAYFAGPLTGLPEKDEAEVTALDERVDAICRNYAYPLALYRPRKTTSPKEHSDIPARKVYDIDQERVASADVVILAGIFPSLGAGMELQLALQSCTYVILLSREGQKLSRMVLGCPAEKKHIEYKNLDDLEEKLKAELRDLTRNFAAFRFRRRALRGADEFDFGKRVAQLRTDLGFSTEDLARMIGVGEAYIESLESKSDRITNPSLVVIRELAKALMTSEVYLVSGQHGLSSAFRDHFQSLEAFATERGIPYGETMLLWNAHHDDYKFDLSMPGVSNRTSVDATYWEERYEELMQPREEKKLGVAKLF
jgi:transcriptional regulator with XRE-family HTH domain